MSTTANKLKQLKALRAVAIERMTDMKVIAESAKVNQNFILQFKARVTQLETLHHEFNTHHSSLIALASTIEDYNMAEEDATRKDFDENYFTVISIQYELFDNSGNNSDNQNVQVDFKSHVKLPQIELVKFDGDPKKWRTFIDTFDALVHNSSLKNIEKFNYLISTLTGPPLALVKCNRLSDATYVIAYDSLKSRYEDRRAMATAHYLELEKAVKIPDSNVTSQGLRHLLDIYEENLAALNNMKFPTSEWDFIIFNMLLNRLDSHTISRFEIEHSSIDIPKLEDLTAFVRKQCNALDRAAEITPNKTLDKPDSFRNRNYSTKPSSNQRPNSSFFTQTQGPITCPFCKRDHLIYRCPKFLALSAQERFNAAKTNRWCINCLGNKHSLKDCSSLSRCVKCHKKHHTHLHFEQVAMSSNNTSPSHSNVHDDNSNITPQNATTLTSMLPDKSTVLLATAVVEVFDSLNQVQTVRILLDSGSQANFITEKCCNRLGLRQKHISLSIVGLGHMNSKASKSVSLTCRPCKLSEPTFSIDAVILPQICNDMPQFTIPHDSWTHISQLNLADPKFHTPGPIDLLLGADFFPLILGPGRLVGNEDEPVAIETVLGWILMGPVNIPLASIPSNSFFCNCDVSLEKSLTRFWELENIPKIISLSSDEQLCESLYIQNVSRTTSGRFTVALPFITPDPTFPESKNIAQRRFLSLERRLLRDLPLYKQYCDFMQDFLSSGHMSLLQTQTPSDDSYYIPHHSVINLNSTTTKLRVVFDASCKSTNGLSLNDSLLTGPKLQSDLFDILLKFRTFPIALTADIRQMYRQINIIESHKKYQRILWRFAPHQPLQEFVLNTVTYGVSSAPYLAIKTLLYLADADGSDFPLAANALKSHTYVDDLVISVQSLEKAKKVKDQLISLLRRGGFELHKWASNDHSLVSAPLTDPACLSLNLDNDSNLKVLGLRWNYSRDTFSFQVNIIDSICTKRSILSELSRIFHPLGFLSPLTFFAKRLIQHLWILGLGWDDTPPVDVVSNWNQCKIELSHISKISIPRHILCFNFSSCELHGFADASQKGYAAVVYLRVQAPDQVSISLICAKSKVSPLKVISVPRLELCAAVLLTELLSKVLNTYQENIQFDRVVAWTDSTVALSWIRSEPYKFPIFVGNRITQIQEKFPPNIWRHIPSADNPADCASRGISSSSQFVNYSLWWAGPSWLSDDESTWPKLPDLPPDSPLEEEKKMCSSHSDS